MTSKGRNWRQTSLAARVTILVGFTFLCCVLMLGLIVQGSINRHFADQDADELRVVAASVLEAVQNGTGNAYSDDFQTRLERAVSGHHGMYYAVYDGRGNELFSTGGPLLADLIEKIPPVKEIDSDNLYQWSEGDKSYRGAILKENGRGVKHLKEVTIVVASSMNFHLLFLEQFSKTLWMILGCSSLVILLTVWIAVLLAHRPLHRISEEISSITTEKFNLRLDPESVPIELIELVTSFNAMMSRMDDLFQRLSHFSADLAHELRTPITNLTTQTQVSLSKEREPEEYREILYSNMEEYERMSRLINDMLWLAQSDNGMLQPCFETLEPAAEVSELFDYLDAWAEDCNVSLNLIGTCPPIRGDRVMLRQALTNLLTNAIRHSPSGTAINVWLESDNDSALLVVENKGDTIPTEHLSKIFERFYRVDPARQRATIGSGTGLGLAIVSSIVTMLGGKITASSENRTTAFQIRLPISSPS